MPENKQYKFSIVIPCFNEEYYISHCIDSILNQNYDQKLIEIVIVDGLSTDGTIALIKLYQSKYSNIKLYENPERATPRALNIGIQHSVGDTIVILGAHTRIDPDFVKYNNKFLNEKDVKVTGGTQINVGLNYTQNLIGIIMQLPFAMASAAYRWSKKERTVDTVVYAAYKRELFDEIGYFEEGFTISEDAELNWRIRQAGYKIFFSPQIKTYYYPRNSVFKFIKQMFRYGILRVNVLKKHLDSIKIIHMIPPIFVLVLLLLIMFSFSSGLIFKFLLILLILHFSISIITSIFKLAPKKLIYLPPMPILIFLMHFSWGLGFLMGLLLPKSKRW